MGWTRAASMATEEPDSASGDADAYRQYAKAAQEGGCAAHMSHHSNDEYDPIRAAQIEEKIQRKRERVEKMRARKAELDAQLRRKDNNAVRSGQTGLDDGATDTSVGERPVNGASNESENAQNTTDTTLDKREVEHRQQAQESRHTVHFSEDESTSSSPLRSERETVADGDSGGTDSC